MEIDHDGHHENLDHRAHRAHPGSALVTNSSYNERMAFPHLVVLIDGDCPLCRGIARRLHQVDWLRRLSFADATSAVIRERFAPGLDEGAALAAMHVVAPDGSRRSGFDGFLRIASVVPLLWIPGAIGALPGIRSVGRFIYRLVAANRTRHARCTDAVCAR
jgi:predicted DCC family thiol-disulfide oxidoreductase YuxK